MAKWPQSQCTQYTHGTHEHAAGGKEMVDTGRWTDSQLERQLSKLESYNTAHSGKPQKLTAHPAYLSPELLNNKIGNCNRNPTTAQICMQCANYCISPASKEHETSLSVGLTLLVAILTVAD